MKNGTYFSTGYHPVEAFLPMLHLKNAGFDFEIATPTGKPAVFDMVCLATGIIMAIGGVVFGLKKSKWKN